MLLHQVVGGASAYVLDDVLINLLLPGYSFLVISFFFHYVLPIKVSAHGFMGLCMFMVGFHKKRQISLGICV